MIDQLISVSAMLFAIIVLAAVANCNKNIIREQRKVLDHFSKV